MSTIGDGIKIGFGLLLFKWLLGLGGCAVLFGSCLVCGLGDQCNHVGRSSRVSVPISSPEVNTSSILTVKTVMVHYSSGCNLRESQSATSKKVGFAPVGTYGVQERSGKWRKIIVNGVVGWAGCEVGTHKAKDED